jgi:hypothetical protein
MTSARFGDGGSGAVATGDKDAGFIPAVYGPSGRWFAFALVKSLLLIYAGLAIGWIGIKANPAWGGRGLLAVAALCILLALFTLVHLFTRKVFIDGEEIEYSGGFGMTAHRLRRDAIAGWRSAMEREYNFEELLSLTDVITIYPSDPGGRRLSLALNAWNFDEDFQHWLDGLPRVVKTDALAGRDRWEAIAHDPMFAPLIAMVGLVYGAIVLLGALLAAKVI